MGVAIWQSVNVLKRTLYVCV